MKFHYTAQKTDGALVEAEREAADKFALYRDLKKEGEIVILAREIGTPFRLHLANLFARRVAARDTISFARNLSGMVAAGFSLSRALAVLERQARNPTLKSVIATISARIGKGIALPSALAEFPRIFPPLVVSMAKAGEESGNLSGALLSASEGLLRTYLLGRKVRGALIYPAIILLAMVVVGVLLFIFVIPELTASFADLHIALPLSTRILIGTSALFEARGVLIGGVLAALFSALLALGQTLRGRRAIDFVLLHTPVLAPLLREVYAARIGETLASLLSAGVPIISALSITSGVVGNGYYEDAFARAVKAVERGEPVSQVLRSDETLFPPLLAEMVAVGEETGKLSGTLKEVGLFFEGEVEQKTKNLSTIIEPVLMIVVGVAVGFFSIAMITPMYSLMNSI